jgi:hypothetical protein
MRSIMTREDDQTLLNVIGLAQHEPVLVRDSEQAAVVISLDDYARLRGKLVADFHNFSQSVGQRAEALGLTESEIHDLLASE